MSDLTVIKSVKDLDSLKPDQQFVVELGELPDDPIELIESPVWAETQKLETLAIEKFSTMTSTVDLGFTVELSETHLTVTATRDVTIELGGDVRDGTRILKTGESTKRKFTKENHGWVSVNGARYETRETV